MITLILCNIYVARTMTADEMKSELTDPESMFVTILAKAFYFPAWVVKKLAH